MEISKLIIAMKDFADDVTFGEITQIANSKDLLNQAHEQFKRVAIILNDANVLRNDVKQKKPEVTNENN